MIRNCIHAQESVGAYLLRISGPKCHRQDQTTDSKIFLLLKIENFEEKNFMQSPTILSNGYFDCKIGMAGED